MWPLITRCIENEKCVCVCVKQISTAVVFNENSAMDFWFTSVGMLLLIVQTFHWRCSWTTIILCLQMLPPLSRDISWVQMELCLVHNSKGQFQQANASLDALPLCCIFPGQEKAYHSGKLQNVYIVWLLNVEFTVISISVDSVYLECSSTCTVKIEYYSLAL